MVENVRAVWPFRVAEAVADGEYVVRAELPGLRSVEDVEITVTGRVLRLRAQRPEVHRFAGRSVRSYGPMARSLMLPVGAKVDAATASYRDGVLVIRFPLDGSPTSGTSVNVSR